MAKSIHFHLFMFITVAATIFILHVSPNFSEISYVISWSLPTGKPTAFTDTKFDSKYSLFL